MRAVQFLLFALAVCAVTVSCAPRPSEVLAHGRFKSVAIDHPVGTEQE